jgi:hypothetical protein
MPHLSDTHRLRRYLMLAVATALISPGLAAGGTALAATGQAASPTISTFRQCTTGSSSGNVNTCMYVNGTGPFINYAIASATVVSSGRTLQVCMYNPDEHQIGCQGPQYVQPDHTLSFTWDPQANEQTGAYCADTGRQNADGSFTIIGVACVSVLSSAHLSTAHLSTGPPRARTVAAWKAPANGDCSGHAPSGAAFEFWNGYNHTGDPWYCACNPATEYSAGFLPPVKSFDNHCGTKVWMQQFVDGGSPPQGWSYCISPGEVKNDVGTTWQNPASFLVGRETGSC